MRTLRKIIKVLVLICLIAGIAACSYLIHEGYDMYKTAVEKEPIAQKVEEIRSRDNYTKIDELPQIYLDAIVSVEDHRFYSHPGVDILAIGRAAINDIKALSLVEGGSGITQQLCKICISHRKRSLQGRLQKSSCPLSLRKSIQRMKYWNFM